MSLLYIQLSAGFERWGRLSEPAFHVAENVRIRKARPTPIGYPETALRVGRGSLPAVAFGEGWVPAEPFRQAQGPEPVEGPRLTEDGSLYPDQGTQESGFQ